MTRDLLVEADAYPLGGLERPSQEKHRIFRGRGAWAASTSLLRPRRHSGWRHSRRRHSRRWHARRCAWPHHHRRRHSWRHHSHHAWHHAWRRHAHALRRHARRRHARRRHARWAWTLPWRARRCAGASARRRHSGCSRGWRRCRRRTTWVQLRRGTDRTLLRHHLPSRGTTNAANRSGKALRGIGRGAADSHASPSGLTSPRTTLCTSNGLAPVVLRRRTLHRHGHNCLSTDQHQAKRALLLALLFLAFHRDLPKFLAVAQN
mmetsp:Transcript_43927/g.95977  ORF Transcript_43927/g.95977 Transcript_43927/m.95977 type:complete len:262 (-) Transcript_43927:203-988(-)